MANLEKSLNAADTRDEAAEILRSLIDKVVLTPDGGAPNGLRAELYGALAEILALDGEPKSKLPSPEGPGSKISVVAGTRSQLCLLLFAKRLCPLI